MPSCVPSSPPSGSHESSRTHLALRALLERLRELSLRLVTDLAVGVRHRDDCLGVVEAVSVCLGGRKMSGRSRMMT